MGPESVEPALSFSPGRERPSRLQDAEKAPLEAAVREIEAAGGKAVAIACDVVDRKSVESALASTVKHFGALHIVVNNAGAVVVAAADGTSDEIGTTSSQRT